MSVFLYLIIMSDGGGRVLYERQYKMPNMEICKQAVTNSKSNFVVSSGDDAERKLGVVIFCASDKVEKAK